MLHITAPTPTQAQIKTLTTITNYLEDKAVTITERLAKNSSIHIININYICQNNRICTADLHITESGAIKYGCIAFQNMATQKYHHKLFKEFKQIDPVIPAIEIGQFISLLQSKN